jgi:hypothetical protein
VSHSVGYIIDFRLVTVGLTVSDCIKDIFVGTVCHTMSDIVMRSWFELWVTQFQI